MSPAPLAFVWEIGQYLSYRSAPKGYRICCGAFKLSSFHFFVFCVVFFSISPFWNTADNEDNACAIVTFPQAPQGSYAGASAKKT